MLTSTNASSPTKFSALSPFSQGTLYEADPTLTLPMNEAAQLEGNVVRGPKVKVATSVVEIVR